MSDPTPAPPPDAAPEKKAPFYKNPFVIGFVLGIAFLTVLPFIQRPFLKAPPPISTLAPWRLPTVDGGVIGSEELKGTVWLASFPAPDCTGECREKQQFFGRALNHIDDLDGGIALVSFAFDSKVIEPPPGLLPGRWYVTRATAAELDAALSSLRAGFTAFGGRDGGATAAEFSQVPGYALIDQNGALRGFWMDTDTGRGNAINAARLLAKYGPNP
ncbi:MAG: hypothetical protein AB1938_30125 [Myxococcota bacterium]